MRELTVLYEDDDVLVVDKPAGLVTHAAGANQTAPSLASLVRDRVVDPDQVRGGIVHRLDRDTSGVMIVAKTTEAKDYLQQQFKQRLVQKTYQTVVTGRIDEPQLKIDLPLSRDPKNRLKRQASAAGKTATTEVTVLKHYPEATLIEARPLTGRTHQLRVHLAAIGHPIVGDRLYGAAGPTSRLLLHAESLELKLPSGQHRRFVSPLPTDFKEYLDRL